MEQEFLKFGGLAINFSKYEYDADKAFFYFSTGVMSGSVVLSAEDLERMKAQIDEVLSTLRNG